MKQMTKRQREVWCFIVEFIKQKGYSPTYEEIRAGFEFSSANAAFDHVQALARKGYLTVQPKMSRTIVVN